MGKFDFSLQPFTKETQFLILEQNWKEVTEIAKEGKIKIFDEELLDLFPRNFSDIDGEFTSILLQTMILSEAFANEANEYCCSREFALPDKFNFLPLFKKFTEKEIGYLYQRKE
jgi:hypothetical protein